MLFSPLQTSLPSAKSHSEGTDGTSENTEQYTFCVDEENVVVVVFNVKGGILFSFPAKPCPRGYDELMRSGCSLITMEKIDQRLLVLMTSASSCQLLVYIILYYCRYFAYIKGNVTRHCSYLSD